MNTRIAAIEVVLGALVAIAAGTAGAAIVGIAAVVLDWPIYPFN